MKNFGLFICLLSGCATTQYGKVSTKQALDTTIQGLEIAVAVGKTLVANTKNASGCYVIASLNTVSSSIKGISESNYTENLVLPSIELDVSACNMMLEQGSQPKSVLQGEISTLLKDVLPKVSRFIQKIVADSEIPCKNKLIATAVLSYIDHIAPAIFNELTEPDGFLSIQGVSVPNTCK